MIEELGDFEKHYFLLRALAKKPCLVWDFGKIIGYSLRHLLK